VAILLPLASSLLYVWGILFLKSSAERGTGIWATTLATNLCAGLAFSALWTLGGTTPEPAPWFQPALVALLFLAGQILGFLAVHHGDVSVATPVMGIKVVLVALFSVVLVGESISPRLWGAAALSSAGIAFLGRGGPSASGGSRGAAFGFGILAAAAFAVFDVLVQKWSPAWGAGRFLPWMMGMTALATLALAAVLPPAWRRVPQGAGRSLACGAALLSMQALLLIGAIAWLGRATSINVVYSARGLWSVLAVWLLGARFGNREREQGPAVFRARLLGAACLTAAVALAVTGP
jgi:drug/metabolite transporter (DMT)-like permease